MAGLPLQHCTQVTCQKFKGRLPFRLTSRESAIGVPQALSCNPAKSEPNVTCYLPIRNALQIAKNRARNSQAKLPIWLAHICSTMQCFACELHIWSCVLTVDSYNLDQLRYTIVLVF